MTTSPAMLSRMEVVMRVLLMNLVVRWREFLGWLRHDPVFMSRDWRMRHLP